MSHGFGNEEADALIRSSVELAQRARDEFLNDNPDSDAPVVAASVGPWGATQHDGSEYTGNYDISDDDLGRFHSERLLILDDAGADVLAVETIPNFREAQVLCDVLDDMYTPAWVSFACRDDRNISDGSRLWAAAALYADHEKVLALGVNCTPPQYVGALIDEIKSAAPDKAIVAYPNSGETYHVEDNSWSGTACDLDREFDVTRWYKSGAKFIGGCCRTGPQDIGAIRARLEVQSGPADSGN